MKTTIKAVNVPTYKHLELTGSFLMESCLNDLTRERRQETPLVIIFIVIMLLMKLK
jgi:hypothetical protein